MNWSAELVALVPPEVVAVTFTTPADSSGDFAVHEVVEEQLTLVAALAPKSIVVAAVAVRKFVPVIVTLVPPVVGPEFGLMELIAGSV